MIELIKPGTNIEFMGRRKLFLAISGAIVTASVVSILILGLNQGIDFKGGTKVIVRFNVEAHVDRDQIRTAVDAMVRSEKGLEGTQIEVQDFDLGATVEEGAAAARRYQIYTEITSLLTEEKKTAIAAAIRARFGETTRIDLPPSGADVFYVSFVDEVAILPRAKEIGDLFRAPPFSYAQVSVVSDQESEIQVDHIRERNLLMAEAEASGEEDALSLPELIPREQMEETLAEMKGTRFTVGVDQLKAKLTAALEAHFPKAAPFVESSTAVSKSVGSDMMANGLLAILYAMIGMLIYIALRFDMRYAPGAVAALIHDVVITIGIFSVLQIKFTLPIIAALLTIVGYSLNDTIVVFDRIRENVEKRRGKSFVDVINGSLNETLSRTLLTSITTLLVVGSILVLGGGMIKDFALALLIGVLIGTYSSIFIASPVALALDHLFAARIAARKAAR